MMKKIPCLLVITIIITIAFLSGCEQKGAEVGNNAKLITLDSTVVELVYSSLNFTKDGSGKVIRADVEYLFKNLVDRFITVKVFVNFYDRNNNLLATGGPKYIQLRERPWTDTGIAPANIITYDGEDAAKVDHATIVANENL